MADEVLSADVLLLSGPPRCGKSDAGRYIAGECQRLGYDVRYMSKIVAPKLSGLAFLQSGRQIRYSGLRSFDHG